jgi:large subunit ribosomal protein L16
MFLQPKKFRYKKLQKGPIKLLNNFNNQLEYGSCGLKALEPGKVTQKEIEMIRLTISRKIKKKAKIWLKIFPNIPITQKPSEVRMGSGKGKVNSWIAKVPSGKIILEIDNLPRNFSNSFLKSIQIRLALRTKIINSF